MSDATHEALVELGILLGQSGYEFVTVTPATHARVDARDERRGRAMARDLRDVFGWSRPFIREAVPSRVFDLLKEAQVLRREGEGYRSNVRFSTLGGQLHVHSAFPTQDADSVFFGPDTYRFCRLLADRGAQGARVVDIGCGSGAGGLCIGSRAGELILADVSPRALDFARVNAKLQSIAAKVVRSDVLGDIDGDFDLVVANPPYMREDDASRIYRDGGGAFGEGLAARIVRETLPRLRPGGRLLLYTGSAIVSGADTFFRSVASALEECAMPFTYEELDPDVFGEELERAAYADVERIAAVALDLMRDVDDHGDNRTEVGSIHANHICMSMPTSSASLIPKPKRDLHETLTTFNQERMAPHWDTRGWEARLADEYAWRLAEGRFVEAERAQVLSWARGAPHDPAAFVAWFEDLELCGPGQQDPLFPWLAERATREQMRWFLRQEMAGEAGFDDLVALTQVKFPAQAKLELARNYWDEMGQGQMGGMHGPLLDRLAVELDIGAGGHGAGGAGVVVEALRLGNLMLALATNRRYAYQSIGALGAIELTAPGRAEHVNAGLRRLGVGGAARRYFALHATLDRKHSAAWNREVLHALVAEDPKVAQPIAEGALLRLNAGARCFDRYRRELGLSPDAASDATRAST